VSQDDDKTTLLHLEPPVRMTVREGDRRDETPVGRAVGEREESRE